MEVIRSKNPKEEAGMALTKTLQKYRTRPILLMLSGGSASSILEFTATTAINSNVTITVLDERFSTDSQINNFAQIEATNFYKEAMKAGVNVISTVVGVGDMLKEAEVKWNNNLHHWRENNPDGVILATMGIGSDGHIAGIIFGGEQVDFSNDNWIVSYVVPKEINQYTERITPTFTFLRQQIDEVIVYATGEDKRALIKKIINSTYVGIPKVV